MSDTWAYALSYPSQDTTNVIVYKNDAIIYQISSNSVYNILAYLTFVMSLMDGKDVVLYDGLLNRLTCDPQLYARAAFQ